MSFKLNKYWLEINGISIKKIYYIDFLLYSYNNNLEPNFDTLKKINKLFCYLLDNKFLNETLGSKFKFVQLTENLFVPFNVNDKSSVFFSVDDYPFENINEDFLDYIRKIDLLIEDEFLEIDFPNYFDRQKAKNNYIKEENININEEEFYLLNDFLKINPQYKELLKSYNSKNNNKDIEVVKYSYFEDHYNDLKNITPKILDNYLDNSNNFNLFISFLYDYNFDYIHSQYSVTNINNWFTIKRGDLFIGGASIDSNYISSKININFINKEKIESNYKSTLKNILKQDNLFDDLIIKNIDENIISKKDIRRLNKDKRIYFTYQEEDLFLEIYNFIVENKLNYKKEEILNDFYQNVIILKQNLINKDDYSYIKESSLINFKNKYSTYKNTDNIIEIDRLNFIKISLSNDSSEKFKHFVSGNENFTTYLYFDLDDNDNDKDKDENINLKIGKNIRKFLEKINIKIEESDLLKLIFNVNNLGKFNINLNDYSLNLNKLYDYLIDNNILKKFETKIIYRLENDKGDGIYRSENSFIEKNALLEYSRRKLPTRDLNLSMIFTKNYEDKDLEEYKKNYYFGFSNLEDIKKWFLDDIKLFKNNEIYLAKYEIPENYIINSSLQVAFIKDKSKFIEKIKYNDLILKEENTKIRKPSI